MLSTNTNECYSDFQLVFDSTEWNEFCIPCHLEMVTVTNEYRALKHVKIQNLGREGRTNMPVYSLFLSPQPEVLVFGLL